jgi:hypothetical protein
VACRPRRTRASAARQFGGAVAEKAAAPAGAGDDLIDELPGQSRERVANRQRPRQDFGDPRVALLDVAIDRSQQQAALAPERGVEARAAQAGDLAQVVERGRLVALAPEHLHRAIERGVGIELSGTGHLPVRS